MNNDDRVMIWFPLEINFRFVKTELNGTNGTHACFSCAQLIFDPMNCSPPGSSVHRILKARILEWVAMPSSRDRPDPGIQTASLKSPALAGGFFATSTTWEAHRWYPRMLESVMQGRDARVFAKESICVAASSSGMVHFCEGCFSPLPGSPTQRGA